MYYCSFVVWDHPSRNIRTYVMAHAGNLERGHAPNWHTEWLKQFRSKAVSLLNYEPISEGDFFIFKEVNPACVLETDFTPHDLTHLEVEQEDGIE